MSDFPLFHRFDVAVLLTIDNFRGRPDEAAHDPRQFFKTLSDVLSTVAFQAW